MIVERADDDRHAEDLDDATEAQGDLCPEHSARIGGHDSRNLGGSDSWDEGLAPSRGATI
jgi:hypothetical protein